MNVWYSAFNLLSGRPPVSGVMVTHWDRDKMIATWWRHQMEISSELLALCEGGPPVPSQRPVLLIFDVFFDVGLNKRLNKQPRCRWFRSLWHSLWLHYNDMTDGILDVTPRLKMTVFWLRFHYLFRRFKVMISLHKMALSEIITAKFINMLTISIVTNLTYCSLSPPCGVEDFVTIGSCSGFLSKGAETAY